MKKIGTLIRETISDDLKQQLTASQGCLFIGFNKMNAFSLTTIRNNLKNVGANVFVAKNTLVAKVFTDLGRNELNGFLSQETAIVIINDKDIVRTCKTIVDFSKENEALAIRGGFLKDKKINAQMITDLAKLPPKEVLLGMAVSGIASPLTGFISTMNQMMLNFLWTVEEIRKVKDKQGKG